MLYSGQVCRMSRIRNLQTVFGRTLAALLGAMVLFLAALAASPSLHEWLHHDADEPGHECSVTVFMHGQVSAATVAPVIAVFGALFGGILLLAQTFVLTPADYRFSPSRAPPRASSLV
jgi:hypothetical protein